MEGNGDVGVVTKGGAVSGAAASSSGEDERFEDQHDVTAALCVVSFENTVTKGTWSASVQQLVACEDRLESSVGKGPLADENIYIFNRDSLGCEFAMIVEEVAVVKFWREQNSRSLETLGECFQKVGHEARGWSCDGFFVVLSR